MTGGNESVGRKFSFEMTPAPYLSPKSLSFELPKKWQNFQKKVDFGTEIWQSPSPNEKIFKANFDPIESGTVWVIVYNYIGFDIIIQIISLFEFGSHWATPEKVLQIDPLILSHFRGRVTRLSEGF